VHTGMRLHEIFNLRYDDIGLRFNPTETGKDDLANFEKRRIVIRKSKTDYKTRASGRTIVMSVPARVIIMSLMAKWYIELPLRTNRKALLFPMSKLAFKEAWKGIIRRSGITNLTFHDLRHEAASRFDELGLTKAEHELMMGHNSNDMTSLYIHADLKRIQQKLDRPYYAMHKSKYERDGLGLPLLGDEIDDGRREEDYALPTIDLILYKP
jgi:integrase